MWQSTTTLTAVPQTYVYLESSGGECRELVQLNLCSQSNFRAHCPPEEKEKEERTTRQKGKEKTKANETTTREKVRSKVHCCHHMTTVPTACGDINYSSYIAERLNKDYVKEVPHHNMKHWAIMIDTGAYVCVAPLLGLQDVLQSGVLPNFGDSHTSTMQKGEVEGPLLLHNKHFYLEALVLPHDHNLNHTRPYCLTTTAKASHRTTSATGSCRKTTTRTARTNASRRRSTRSTRVTSTSLSRSAATAVPFCSDDRWC